MEYFVDEMPRDCASCKHYHMNCADGYSCSKLRKEIHPNFSDGIGYRHQDCPLLSLADYTKQVRAESEADKKALICDYESRITKHQELMSWLEHNNDELKQQLHDLPKKIVEEIKTEVEKEKSDNDLAWLGFKKLNRILDTILKKYGGEENGKSNM